jgi:hypothetical protein
LQGRFLLQESHLTGFLLAWRVFDPEGIGRIPLCQFRYLCEVIPALALKFFHKGLKSQIDTVSIELSQIRM